MQKSLFNTKSFTSLFVLLSLMGTPECVQAGREGKDASAKEEFSEKKNRKKRNLDDKEKEEAVVFDPTIVKKEKTSNKNDLEMLASSRLYGFNNENQQSFMSEIIDIADSHSMEDDRKEALANTNAAPDKPMEENRQEAQIAPTQHELKQLSKKEIDDRIQLANRYFIGKMPGGKTVDNDKIAIGYIKDLRDNRAFFMSALLFAQGRSHGLLNMNPDKVYNFLVNNLINANLANRSEMIVGLHCLERKKSLALSEEVDNLKKELADLKKLLGDRNLIAPESIPENDAGRDNAGN